MDRPTVTRLLHLFRRGRQREDKVTAMDHEKNSGDGAR